MIIQRSAFCTFVKANITQSKQELTFLALITAIKQCGKTRDLERGKALHLDATQSGHHTNKYIANALITMYSKCGSMLHAQEVFDRMTYRDVVSWNSLILGYVENGESLVAIDLFTTMDCERSSVTFVAALKACASLASAKQCDRQFTIEKGIVIHRQAKGYGFVANVLVATTLVDMYRKYGCMYHARAVFDSMSGWSVVSWNSLILGYVEYGEHLLAMNLFKSMLCEPDPVTFVAALKACTGLANEKNCKQSCLEKGMVIQRLAEERGFHTQSIVANTLIDMYSKCGSMQYARDVFNNMMHRDVVSWNVLITGYVENRQNLAALDLFNRMDCEADSFTYVAALKACVGLLTERHLDRQFCLEKGTAIHIHIKERGLHTRIFVANSLMDMYRKCGSMQDARAVFDSMIQRDVVSWTILILGYVENCQSSVALDLFMSTDCEMNSITFVGALKACGNLASENTQLCLETGKEIHKRARECGFEKDVLVATTLVDMYSRCGSMLHARSVLDEIVHRDAVLWSTLILGYVENGESLIALDLLTSMDCQPNCGVFVASFKACAAAASENKMEKHSCLLKGMDIHRKLNESGFEGEMLVASALVDMYSKCGSMSHAQEAFNSINCWDTVSWNMLILGYVENGESSVAMDLFVRIDCEPDSATFVAALKACASLGLLSMGRRIHSQVCRLGCEHEQVLSTMLVDFYGRCASLVSSEVMFYNMHSPDIVSWNALVAGYSSLGDALRVFKLVSDMQEGGIQMDRMTFMLVLTTCSHVGMVEEGLRCFESMLKYDIEPGTGHYHCMVDMLGRANRLSDALLLVKSMPFEANSATWTTLLAACKNLRNLEVGKVAFDALIACSDKRDAAPAYVLMGDIYSMNHGEINVCNNVYSTNASPL